MKIALTGASGFIGSWTASALTAAGHSVQAMARPTSRRDHVDCSVQAWITGCVEDRTTHTPLLDGCEALVHNAVDWRLLKDGETERHLDANLTASIELLSLAAKRGLRIVFVSSVAVHHHMHPSWNGRIDGLHPTRPGGLYGACKAAIEAHLWALKTMHGVPVTIIRPAAVYGIDPSIERSIGTPIIQRIRRGDPLDRPGGGKFVHVEDVAESISRSLSTPEADGGVYHLADCYARWSDWGHMACDVLGTEVQINDASPPAPKNMFTTDDLASDLDLSLCRGHEGIRAHIEDLASRL